jgi:hypothetical protein
VTPADRAFIRAERWAHKHRLSDSQTQVLRGMLVGLTDKQLTWFENKRRSIDTVTAHRADILGRFSKWDMWLFAYHVWRSKRTLRKLYKDKVVEVIAHESRRTR